MQKQFVIIQVRAGSGLGSVNLKDVIHPKALSSLVAEQFLKGAV